MAGEVLSFSFKNVSSTFKEKYFASYKKLSYGPCREKICLRGFANNTGPDQPAPLRSLISSFVICLLNCILYGFATSEIALF